MNIPFAQIDAFASAPFTGNPAAVMPLHAWLDDTTLQAIAAENNLSETAFLVPSGDDDADFELRWFTPTVEGVLCGHATLASGPYVLTADPAPDIVCFRPRQAGGPTGRESCRERGCQDGWGPGGAGPVKKKTPT